MRVAVGKLTLDFWNNDSAAAKRRQLEELCSSLRKKFNLSILEVDQIDEPETGVIGFAAAIPEHWKTTSIQAFIEKIGKEIEAQATGRVVSEDTEILEF